MIYPEDRWMDGFVVDSIQNSLTLDTHPNMRAMTHHAETPAELAGLFDVVAYDKGEIISDFNTCVLLYCLQEL